LPRVAGTLATRGFTAADKEEGWNLLKGASGAFLERSPPLPVDPKTLELLDRWENLWFPVADATLARHYAALHRQVFLNLSQTSGVEVAVSVHTCVTRLRALEKTGEGQAALALLAQRGLTEAVLVEAEQLLTAFGSLPEVEAEPSPEQAEAALRAAEDAMWAWYLEWSRIARSVITDRRQLRALGFLTSSGATVAEDEADIEDDEPDEIAAPPSAARGAAAHANT
jgi:hypothetical protein